MTRNTSPANRERRALLLRRYEQVVGDGRSYERGAARSMLLGYLHTVGCERMHERGDHGLETERLIDEVIARTPRDSDWEGPWVARGDLLEYRREHAAALACYDAALKRKADSAYAWSGKASCLVNLGRFAEALACLDRAAAQGGEYWHIPTSAPVSSPAPAATRSRSSRWCGVPSSSSRSAGVRS